VKKANRSKVEYWVRCVFGWIKTHEPFDRATGQKECIGTPNRFDAFATLHWKAVSFFHDIVVVSPLLSLD
jgi:hypothetical protein